MKVFFSILLCLLLQAGLLAQVKPDAYSTMQRDSQDPSATLLLAASAFQAKKKNLAKEMIDRAFSLDPVATVDAYDGEVMFEQFHTSKFNNWFESRLKKEIRSSSRTRTSSSYKVYADAMNGYVDTDVNYMIFIDSARDLMMRGNYKTAHSMYRRAFRTSERSVLSLTRAAACAFAAGKKDWADAHLDAAFQSYPYSIITRLRTGAEFIPFLKDEDFTRWVGEKILRQFPDLDNELMAEIDELWEDFTLYRSLAVIDSPAMKKSLGADSESIAMAFRNTPVEGYAEKQAILDRKCALRLTRMFKRAGFPGPSLIGDRATQLGHLLKVGAAEDWVKWKPILIDGHDNSSDGYYIAAAYDMMMARSGQPQLYGTYSIRGNPENSKSESYYWPIVSLENLHLRRAKMGLSLMKRVVKASRYKWPPALEVTDTHLQDLKDRKLIWTDVRIQFRE